jgi:hypothetical protein
MDFGVTGINHEPLKVRGIDKPLKQSLPDAFVAPAAKAPMSIIPVAVFWRKVSPRRSRAQYPEHSVDKKPVVFCDPSPHSSATW